MPKILHIGGVNSPHVSGIVEQIAQNTNFDQSIISYPVNPTYALFSTMNKYYYPYQKFFINKAVSKHEEDKLSSFVKNIIIKEKPDIIHGHYLSKCSTIMYYALLHSKKPGVVVPWSVWDIPKNKYMFERNKRCVNLCQYIMCNNTKFLHAMLDAFKQPRRKQLFSFPPIRLYLYDKNPPDTSVPRLLITRKHYQDLFMQALPKVISMFPQMEITTFSPEPIVRLAKKLGIYNKINFIQMNYKLPQEEFSSLIQKHNIVRSMAPDHGTSSTTLQAAYSGAVVLGHKSPWDYLVDNVNVIKCDLTVEDMQNKLIYAINNLKTLCPMFKKNNEFLKNWDAGITWNNLFNVYKTLL